jgi:ribosome-associated protein
MEDEQEDFLPLSRTRKKQQAKEIEKLADQLAEMPDNQFKQLTISGQLRQEVELARATKGRSSHRRQVKHLAGMLRKQDDELHRLQEQLQHLDQVSRSEKKDFHRLEKLRDRLCEASSFDEAFNEMLNFYPQIDRKAISRLARSVHQHNDRRAYREIFKRLRDSEQAEET